MGIQVFILKFLALPSTHYPKSSQKKMFQQFLMKSFSKKQNYLKKEETQIIQQIIAIQFPSSETVQKSLKLQKNIKTNEDDEQHSKSRFRPAHEIYDRIKHDNSIDQDFVIIGYLDRFKGIKETPFNSFVTLDNERHYNTSIPFHRIRHYKYKDTVVWDRDSRINLIDGNAFMNI